MDGKFWLGFTFSSISGIENSETLFHKKVRRVRGVLVIEWVKQRCNERS